MVQELGLEDSFVITYVGAHGVANHLIQLIDAAEKLQDTNIIFQLIGSGMRKEFLQKEVSKRNLSNVIFREPVPKLEVFKYILASDVGTSVLKNVETFNIGVGHEDITNTFYEDKITGGRLSSFHKEINLQGCFIFKRSTKI